VTEILDIVQQLLVVDDPRKNAHQGLVKRFVLPGLLRALPSCRFRPEAEPPQLVLM
jgi:hypothetical protein